MRFDQFDLDPRLLTGIEKAGWAEPTPIQSEAIGPGLEGRDVLGLAQTGTGKTGAFMIPILQKLTTGPLREIRALVLAPTRELAEQIRQSSEELARDTQIRTLAVYGGVRKRGQVDELKKGVEVLVACPGRLLDLLGDRALDLSKIEFLVVDEADRMFDMGFLPDVKRILRQLPENRQTLFFSATMPGEIRRLSSQILRDPVKVQVDIIAPAKTVSHALYPVSPTHKTRLLVRILDEHAGEKVLIFTRTKHRATRLTRDLKKRGYNVAEIQGDLPQSKRTEAMEGFRKGKFQILVATDIAARGIDVQEISHVINFDMPDNVDQYTHRIGRTGRARQSGEAFTLITHADEPMVNEIEMTLGDLLERRMLEGFDYGNLRPSGEETEGTRRKTRPIARSARPAPAPAPKEPEEESVDAGEAPKRYGRRPKWKRRVVKR